MLHHQESIDYSRELWECSDAIDGSWKQHLCEKFCGDFEVSLVSKILESNFDASSTTVANYSDFAVWDRFHSPLPSRCCNGHDDIL
jgi:hypothetical protein